MIDKDLKKKIAGMIMVGFREAEVSEDTPVLRAIRDFSLGGVILYNIDLKCFLEAQKTRPDLSRNEAAGICPKNIISRGQLKALTSTLQKFSGPPLLIATDQEGGLVSRLGPSAGFPERESPESLGGRDDLTSTFRVADGMAGDLHQSGINLNLAPLIDLALNPEGPLARNGRSFGSDPELVFRHSKAFIEAHRRNGVLTCLKHFPGKGSAGQDTHWETADVTSTYQEKELSPFARLIREGLADLVMTSHVNHRGWDPEFPVTLSRKILQEILRGKLGYRGPIISDDLLMGAIIRQYTLEEACVLAVRAGVDILLASNNTPEGDDPELFNRIFEALVKAFDRGRISRSLIEDSHSRLEALRARLAPNDER